MHDRPRDEPWLDRPAVPASGIREPDLSHSTVKHHRANALSKVGAATTALLVWIPTPRLREPDGIAHPDESRLLDQVLTA